MEQEELLSKKELLKLTNISYGQLYRWKRQNLIPEAWFIKQSSFTGQETYFPKDKIIKRINTILELKDKYSLEELAVLLSPEATDKKFDREDFNKFFEQDEELLKLLQQKFSQEYYSFKELIFFSLCKRLRHELSIEIKDVCQLIDSFTTWIPKMVGSAYTFFLYKAENNYFACLIRNEGSILPDLKLEQVYRLDLEELAKEIKFNRL